MEKLKSDPEYNGAADASAIGRSQVEAARRQGRGFLTEEVPPAGKRSCDLKSRITKKGKNRRRVAADPEARAASAGSGLPQAQTARAGNAARGAGLASR